MKKTMIFILAISILVSMAACASEPQNEFGMTDQPAFSDPFGSEITIVTVPTEQRNPYVTAPDPVIGTDSDPWNEDPDVFGTPVTVINTLIEGSGGYVCNVPEDATVREYDDHVFARCDGQLLLLGVSDSTYLEPCDLESSFETLIPRMEVLWDMRHEFQAENHKMTIKEQKLVDIAGRTMLQVRGSIVFTENQVHERTWAFLGYAVPLSTGNYAYFLAAYYNYDYIQTRKLAVNMAHSFWEVTS